MVIFILWGPLVETISEAFELGRLWLWYKGLCKFYFWQDFTGWGKVHQNDKATNQKIVYNTAY